MQIEEYIIHTYRNHVEEKHVLLTFTRKSFVYSLYLFLRYSPAPFVNEFMTYKF